jgi:hypothetical protein
MKRTATFVALVLGALAVAAMPAGAGNGNGNGNGAEPVKGSKEVEVKGPKNPGESQAIVTTETSDAVEVDVADLGPDAGLVGTDGTTLGTAAAAGTTYIVTWSQKTESLLWGIAWKETHKGAFYYNGNAVWVRKRFSWDTQGFHRCGYNSGFGFTIDVKSCWKTGDPSFVGSRMTNGDQFKVSVLVSGFPISATHEMRACMYPSGRLIGC